MVQLVSVEPDSALVDAARDLFTQYRGFLETIESTHCFNFERYRDEIATLPSAYTDARGELLLALVDDVPAGCIAFRASSSEAPACEIKRLFVVPAYRKHGVSRRLIEHALEAARARGFLRVILDTDIVSMSSAYATYKTLGFTEYTPPGSHAPSLRFLQQDL